MTTQNSILSLPNELIAEITVASQNGDDEKTKSELILSSICRRFRDAVISAPELWTKVEMEATSERSVNLSQLYLERSAAREVWITLRAFGVGDVRKTSGLLQLTPHLTRISRLTVASDYFLDLEGILDIFSNVAVPSLRHFEVVKEGPGFPDSSYRIPEDLFSVGAPRLSSLSLSYCSTGAPGQWMNSITHIDLKNAASLTNGCREIFTDITSQLPLLTDLNLDMSRFETMEGTGISSRCLTHIRLDHCGDDTRALLDILSCFDTPALSDLTLYECHGDQISVLFNSDSTQFKSSFSALASLSCVQKEPEPETTQCKDNEDVYPHYQTIASPPIHLFPRLSSWSLINQCFTARMLTETLGRNSRPWPLLQTVTVWPLGPDIDAVYDILREVVQWKRESQEAVPKLRLSQSLFLREYWVENGVDVELVEAFT
ncbi:hypothetical protein FB45DRAFT_1059140 [Roridomyces roridus]|uniref:F-box domain-containing protein n=1 Tax=Roridomyces roridus TaxID=1738132 RepID=A0AAD7BQS6_9AGAR|nr:hypothetical protein FB45DRAFT_1059140 [Roridomyces roridus]